MLIYMYIYFVLFVPENFDWNWDGLAGLVKFSTVSFLVSGKMQNPTSSSQFIFMCAVRWSEWL